MEILRVSAVQATPVGGDTGATLAKACDLIRECGQHRAKDEIIRAKFDFDVRGHYARPDVFKPIVDERAKPAVEVER